MGYAGSEYHKGPGYINDPLEAFGTTAFYNTEQSVTNTCPSGFTGDPVTAVIQAGIYVSFISQADADAIAYAVAVVEAEALRQEFPCSPI